MNLRTIEKTIEEELLASNFSLANSNVEFNFAINCDSNKEFAHELLGTNIVFKNNIDMFDILVEMKVFKSKSDARKNWKKSDAIIEEGLSTFLVGKKNIPLFIWNCPKDCPN